MSLGRVPGRYDQRLLVPWCRFVIVGSKTEERNRSQKTKLCRQDDPVTGRVSTLQIRHLSLWASRRSLASFLAFKALCLS
jgi:hypothetical protein